VELLEQSDIVPNRSMCDFRFQSYRKRVTPFKMIINNVLS